MNLEEEMGDGELTPWSGTSRAMEWLSTKTRAGANWSGRMLKQGWVKTKPWRVKARKALKAGLVRLKNWLKQVPKRVHKRLGFSELLFVLLLTGAVLFLLTRTTEALRGLTPSNFSWQTWAIVGGAVLLVLLLFGLASARQRRPTDHHHREDEAGEDEEDEAPARVPPPPPPPAHAGGGHAHHGHGSSGGAGMGFFWFCAGLALLVGVGVYAQGHWPKSPAPVRLPVASAETTAQLQVRQSLPTACRLTHAPPDAVRISADDGFGESIASGQTHDSLMCTDAGDMVEFVCGPTKDGPWSDCGYHAPYYRARSRMLIPGTNNIAPVAPFVWFES